jgi:hypothetical protein
VFPSLFFFLLKFDFILNLMKSDHRARISKFLYIWRQRFSFGSFIRFVFSKCFNSIQNVLENELKFNSKIGWLRQLAVFVWFYGSISYVLLVHLPRTNSQLLDRLVSV